MYFYIYEFIIIYYVYLMGEVFFVINNKNNNSCKSIIMQQNKKSIMFSLIRPRAKAHILQSNNNNNRCSTEYTMLRRQFYSTRSQFINRLIEIQITALSRTTI
jgi:hypothetical protein